MNFTGKILVSDDEAHIRKFLGLVLGKLGQPVVLEAVNGQEAIATYALHKPDLVLLDVNMPVVDGVQALTSIRQSDPDALVVMLTSLANRQTVEECARLGAAGYLRKDLPRDELVTRLAQIIAEYFQSEEEAVPPSATAP
jgi:two-component system chemotaxis response regulator CheY